MATSIGKLALQLTASPAGLISGLNTGMKKIDGFAAGVGKTLGALANPPALKALQGSFKKAFAPVLDTEGVFAEIHEIGKLSDALGLSTEDLIGLQRAAKRAGASPEQLTKGLMALERALGKATLMDDAAADGFETFGNKAEKSGSHVSASTKKLAADLGMSVAGLLGLERQGLGAGVSTDSLAAALKTLDANLGRVGEAGDTTGAALEALGLKTDDFLKLSADQRALALAGALKGVQMPDAAGEGGAKVQAAIKLFGDGAADALKTLSAGPDALKQSVKEATDTLARGLKGLEKFGLDPDALALKPMGETVRIIADRFKELPTTAEKTGLAMAAFGRGGQLLMRLLEGGGKGIDEMIAKAQTLGVSFSRAEAMRVQQARGALASINDAFKGIKMQLAIQLAPAITVITEGFTGWLEKAGGIPAIVKKIAGVMWTVADAVLAVVEGLATVVGLLDPKGLKTGLAKSVGAVGTLLELMGHKGATRAAIDLTGPIDFDAETPSNAIGKLRTRLKELRGEMDTTKQEVPSLAESLGARLKAAEAAQKGLKSPLGGALAGLLDMTGPLGLALPKLDELVKNLRADLERALGADKATAGLKRISDQAEALGVTAEEAAVGLKHQLDVLGMDEAGQKIFDIDQKRAVLVAELNKMTALATDAEKVLTDQQRLELLAKINLAHGQIGEVDARTAGIRALGDELAARQKQQEMLQKAKSVFEETRTPLEQWTTKTGELTKMLQSGALDWETYKRAIDKTTEALTGATQARDSWNAGAAVLEGTGAAISAMNQARFGDRLAAGGNRAEQLLAEQKVIMEAQKAALLGILNNAKDQGAAVLDALKGAKGFLPGG